MKVFDIFDRELERSLGALLYYEKDAGFIVELEPDLDEWTAPLLFTAYVKKGIFTIPREISFLWVKERIIPSGRQNIQSVLENHRLHEYDEMRFLEISKGICSQDSIVIQKLNSLPRFIKERQEKNLVDLVVLDGFMLLCFFADGKTKKVDLTKLSEFEGIDKVLKNCVLFQSGKVGTGGYFATFNDSIDVPSWLLYQKGQEIPLNLSDFKTFVKRNVLTTSESCDLLQCSRQNVAYMVNQKQLEPMKVEEKGSLYLKGDLIRTKW